MREKTPFRESQRRLEELVLEDTKISVRDRLHDAKEFVSENKKVLIRLGAAAGFAVAAYATLHSYIPLVHNTADYEKAYDFVSNALSLAKPSGSPLLESVLSKEVIEIPLKILKESSSPLYRDSAKEIVSFIESNEQFLGQSASKSVEVFSELQSYLKPLTAGTRKSFMPLVSLIEAYVSVHLGFNSIYDLFHITPYQGICREKRKDRKNLSSTLSSIEESLAINPNAPLVYALSDKLISLDFDKSEILDIIEFTVKLPDEKYAPFLEKTALNASHELSYHNFSDSFWDFENQVDNNSDDENSEPENEGLASESDSTFKLSKDEMALFYKLRPKLQNDDAAVELVNMLWDCGSSNYFMELILNQPKLDYNLISNVVSFKRAFSDFPEDKMDKMLKIIIEDKKFDIASALAHANIDNQSLMKYILSLSDIPGIGVGGQLRTFAALNSTARLYYECGLDFDFSALEKIVSYEAKSNREIIEISRFMESYPDASPEEGFELLQRYYYFTQGKSINSNWLKKSKISESAAVPEKTRFGKKVFRKFIEELEQKVKLAQYEAFNHEISVIYNLPLQNILGDGHPADSVKVDERLKNVITGYNHMPEQEVKQVLKEMLSVYLFDPEHFEEKRLALPGNASLLENLDRKISSAWNGGLSREYPLDSGASLKIYDSKDFLDSLQMGVVSQTCTSIADGCYAFSAVVNSLDFNKKIIYLANGSGNPGGRCLLTLCDDAIIAYDKYGISGEQEDKFFIDYLSEFGCYVDMPVFIPRKLVKNDFFEVIRKRGYLKYATLETTLQKAEFSLWYDNLTGSHIKDFPKEGIPVEAEGWFV
jgi:hypothetical protein